MATNVRKMKPYTTRWHKEAYELLRTWHPVIACCNTCGDTDPSNPNPED